MMRSLRHLATTIALLLITSLHAAENPGIPPAKDTEPSVSEEEAAQLATAAARARSDAAGAAELLHAQDTAESSAALPFAESLYWHRAGKTEQARQALGRALARHPRFHRARLNLAKLLMQQSKHAEASRELRALLGTDTPDRAEAWRLLAYTLQEQAQLPAAEMAYRQAIAFFPTERALRLGLLSCLIEQQRYAEAIPWAKQELGVEPTKRQLWGLLINAELAAGRRERALHLLECARRLGAADAHMLALLGDLYLDQSLPVPALACYRQAAALKNAPVGRLLSGFEALVLSRNSAQATELGETIGRSLAQLTPRQRLRFRSLRASLAASKGDPAGAISEYRLVLKEDPIHGETLLALADLLIGKAPGEARQLLARAARLDPYQIRAWTALARLAVEEGDLPAAVALVQRALAKKPDAGLERYLNQIRAAIP